MIQKSIENIHKGDVFYADLGENVGSEQNGIRPLWNIVRKGRIVSDRHIIRNEK